MEYSPAHARQSFTYAATIGSLAIWKAMTGGTMQIALTTLRAALADKLGCVLTPELVAEIVFRTAQTALQPTPSPAPKETS